MNKGLLYLAVTIGGAIGAYAPVILFRVDGFSIWSIVGSVLGSFVGIYVVYKMDL